MLTRVLRPEDEALYPDFVAAVTPDDWRLRLFSSVSRPSAELITRLTHYDPAHAFAFIALDATTGAMLGVVRLHNDPGDERGEFAVLVRSALKGQGLGWLLMERMIAGARDHKLKQIHGQVLRENVTMLRMCRELGFAVEDDPTEAAVERVTLDLAS